MAVILPPQIDSVYVAERIAFLALFAAVFALFAAQNAVRVFATTPKQPLFARRNAKSVNHLAGLSAAFWALVCWTDVHHVFLPPAFAALNEFAFAAAFCSLITGYVLHVAIALRAFTVNGFFSAGAARESPGTGGGGKRSWRWWCGKVDFTGHNGVVFWVSLVSPWAGAVAMTVAQVVLDKAWPNIMFNMLAAVVIVVAASRLIMIRRRLAKELSRLNPNEQRMYERGMKNMRRWQRFTRMSVVLVGFAVIVAAGFCYVFLTEDVHTPLVFLDPARYELGGGGFSTAAGLILFALLAASLWFSWMWPGVQIISSGHTNTNTSITISGTGATGGDSRSSKRSRGKSKSAASAAWSSAGQHHRLSSAVHSRGGGGPLSVASSSYSRSTGRAAGVGAVPRASYSTTGVGTGASASQRKKTPSSHPVKPALAPVFLGLADTDASQRRGSAPQTPSAELNCITVVPESPTVSVSIEAADAPPTPSVQLASFTVSVYREAADTPPAPSVESPSASVSIEAADAPPEPSGEGVESASREAADAPPSRSTPS